MKKLLFSTILLTLILKPAPSSAQLFFASDYPKLVLNSANADIGTMIFLMYQSNISYERFVHLWELEKKKDGANLVYILNMKVSGGVQTMLESVQEGFRWGGNIAIIACNQLTNFRRGRLPSLLPQMDHYTTIGLDIGLVKYLFAEPMISRSDLLPVLQFSYVIYYDKFNIRYHIGFPYTAGIGIGYHFRIGYE